MGMFKRPFFSVVIPTYNRPERLRACLESFLQLAYPADRWELIVVNDGGADSFTAVDDQLQAQLPLRLVDGPHAGPAAARNLGASLATGTYLAFTDDDCQIFPDWLDAFAHGFADPHWDALGGRAVTPFEQNVAEQAWQHLTDFLYEFMRDDRDNLLLLISNNVAYRREAFEKVGGFNETFPLAAAEDMELSYRMLRAGYHQRFWGAAKIWHYHHLTIWGHLRQQFRYGRGGYYFSRMQRLHYREPLMKLYYQEYFYPSLWQSLRRQGKPVSVQLLVRVAQVAYRWGIRYQGASSLLA